MLQILFNNRLLDLQGNLPKQHLYRKSTFSISYEQYFSLINILNKPAHKYHPAYKACISCLPGVVVIYRFHCSKLQILMSTDMYYTNSNTSFNVVFIPIFLFSTAVPLTLASMSLTFKLGKQLMSSSLFCSSANSNPNNKIEQN